MRPRVALICHHDAPLHRQGFARWLASWADLTAVVVITERRQLLKKRLVREYRRVGLVRLLDVLAFRLYYRLFSSKGDSAWISRRLSELEESYPAVGPATRVVQVASPNSREAQDLLESARPDLTFALCKSILAERVFSIARRGTIVLHPGICPEYRNAHGCFWALANDDLERVGMTMLRIDRGIDTGPVLGFFSARFDELGESHIVIQHRVVFDNLAGIAALATQVVEGAAEPLSTAGRASHEWGQPWLTKYWRWKRQAHRRARERTIA